MRKYKQLILLLISCFSVAVLLFYKSENNRLKYVLRVVNFFGRNDAAIMKGLDNSTNDEEQPVFAYPMPAWQAISESFHAYSAYWDRNELVAGSEAFALVVGKRGAVVNFRCSLLYDRGARIVQGKFHFQRVDNDFEDANSEFTSYRLFCRLTRDFGKPESVIFTDVTSSTSSTHKLKLRYLRKDKEKLSMTPQLATVCLDLLSFNTSSSTDDLMQFFFHHHILGVEHFIVYNGDEVPPAVHKLLRHKGIQLHSLLFNFPFAAKNATERLRRIIEADCFLRNTNLAKYTLLLGPNEYFYPNTKLVEPNSVLHSMHHYAADIQHFEMPTFAVCMDHSHKLLIDNTLYDPEVKSPHRIFIYRPFAPETTRSVALQLSMAFVHRYINCLHVGKDGLHDWRSSLREDFMQHVQAARNELDALV